LKNLLVVLAVIDLGYLKIVM